MTMDFLHRYVQTVISSGYQGSTLGARCNDDDVSIWMELNIYR